MRLVLDVNAAVEVCLRRGGHARFSRLVGEAERVIAPDIYVSESANTAWKYYRAKALSREAAAELAENCLEFVDELISANALWKEALAESMRLGHPVYDLLYLISARRNDAVLASADERLLGLAHKLGIQT